MRKPFCFQCPDSGPGGSGCQGTACRWTEWTDDGSVLVDDGHSAFGGTADGYPALVRSSNGRYVSAWLKCCARRRPSPFSFEQTENCFRYECEVLSALAGSPFVPRCLVRARTDAARVRASVAPPVRRGGPRRTWTAAHGGDTIAVWYAMTRAPGRPWADCRFGGRFRRPLFLLCQALADFHRRGFGHYDLKPENIHYDPESGFLQLVDFGFAKGSAAWRADPAHRNDAVVEAMRPGSMPWVSPEHHRNRFLELTPRADDYVFGLIFVQTALDETADWIVQNFTAGRGQQAHPVSPSGAFRDDLYLRLSRRTSDTVARLVVHHLLADRPEVRSGALENLLAELRRLGWDRDGEPGSPLPWGKIAAVAAAVAILVGGIVWISTRKPEQSSENVPSQQNESTSQKSQIKKKIEEWTSNKNRKTVLSEMKKWWEDTPRDRKEVLAFYRNQTWLRPNCSVQNENVAEPDSIAFVDPWDDQSFKWDSLVTKNNPVRMIRCEGTYQKTGKSFSIPRTVSLFENELKFQIPLPSEPTVQEIVDGWRKRYDAPFALLGEMREYWDGHADPVVRKTILDFYRDRSSSSLWPTVTIANPGLVTANTKILNTDQWNTLDLSKATISPQDKIIVTVSGTYTNGKPLIFTTNIPLFAERAEIELPSPPEPETTKTEIDNVIEEWKKQYGDLTTSYNSILLKMSNRWQKHTDKKDRVKILSFYKDSSYRGLWPTVTIANPGLVTADTKILNTDQWNTLDLSKTLISTQDGIVVTVSGTYANGKPLNFTTNIPLFAERAEIELPSPPESALESQFRKWDEEKGSNAEGVLAGMRDLWDQKQGDRTAIYKYYCQEANKILWPKAEVVVDGKVMEDSESSPVKGEFRPMLDKGRIRPPQEPPPNGKWMVKYTARWKDVRLERNHPINVEAEVSLFTNSVRIELSIPAPTIADFIDGWVDRIGRDREKVLDEMRAWWDEHQGWGDRGDREKLWDWYRSTDSLHPTYTLDLPSEAESPKFDPPAPAASGRLCPPKAMPSGATFRVSYTSTWKTTKEDFSGFVDVPIFASSVEFPTPSAPERKDLVLRTFRDFNGSQKGISPATVSGTKRIVRRGDAGYRTPADQFSGVDSFREADKDLSVQLTNRDDFKWIEKGDSVYCGSQRIGAVAKPPISSLLSVSLDAELLKPGEYCELTGQISIGDKAAVEARWKSYLDEGNWGTVLSQMETMAKVDDKDRLTWLETYWNKNQGLWPVVSVANPNGFPIVVDERTIAANGTGRFSVFVPFKGTETWTPTIVPDAEHEGYKSSGGLSVPVVWNIDETSVTGPTFTAPKIEIKPTDVSIRGETIDLEEAQALYNHIRRQLGQPKKKMTRALEMDAESIQKIRKIHPGSSMVGSLKAYAKANLNVWGDDAPFTEDEWKIVENAAR